MDHVKRKNGGLFHAQPTSRSGNPSEYSMRWQEIFLITDSVFLAFDQEGIPTLLTEMRAPHTHGCSENSMETFDTDP